MLPGAEPNRRSPACSQPRGPTRAPGAYRWPSLPTCKRSQRKLIPYRTSVAAGGLNYTTEEGEGLQA